MLEVTVTTSMGKTVFMLDVPVSDKIDLHYDGCLYCNGTLRKETILSKIGTEKERHFCAPSHRQRFYQKEMTS